MKTKISLILICLLVSSQLFAQKKKANNETLEFRYEAEAAVGQAVQGFTLVKVYSYSKDKNTAMAQAGKNAVHAVLFRGTADYVNGNTRIKGQKPLISNVTVYDENLEYFKEFFQDGGQFQRYVQMVNNGIPDAGDIIKVGKEYKVGVKVLVNKDALRKTMESAGIIKGLGGMF